MPTLEKSPGQTATYHGGAPHVARLPREMVASSDYERIRVIQSEYTSAWEAQRSEQEALFKAWRYYFGYVGEQWEEDQRKYKEERDQRIAQYNIIKNKVNTFTGMLIADEYDFKYDPVNKKRDSGIDALENAYYCDKEICHYDENYNLMIQDGVIHLGVLEIGVTTDFDPRGNIWFKRQVPGRWIVDPYWKTDDCRDCTKAWKQGNMTIKQLQSTFKNLPSSPRYDAEVTRIKQVGMDWTSANINEYNHALPKFQNAFHVVEYHWIENIKKKRLMARNFAGAWVAFPVTDEVERLEKFALENGVTDWKEGESFIAPYIDKVHWSGITCEELFPFKFLEYGKPEIQTKTLPIIQFACLRDIAGRNQGIVNDLIDPQKDLNYNQSKISELLANALGGGTIYDKNRMPDEKDQEEFEKSHNDPTKAWGLSGPVDGFSRKLQDHQVNPELIRQSGQAFDYSDRLSGVSAAMSSREQASGEPASLFAMKLKVNKIGTMTVDKRVQRVREHMAESYFYQAQITYKGTERKFTSKDGKKESILNEDLGNGYTRNDVTEMPRVSVTISEAEGNLSKQLRDRTDVAAVLQAIPPEYREAVAIAIDELFKTTTISEDKKMAISEALMLERIKARLNIITEIKNSDAIGKQAELSALQAQGQVEKILAMLSQQGAPETPEMITQQPQQQEGSVTIPEEPQQTKPIEEGTGVENIQLQTE